MGYVTSSSGGFILPNSAMRVPDAAWIRKEHIEVLTKEERLRFPNLCPDFVIEVRSPSDSLTGQQEKMQEWIDNGCLLAWLIDLAEQNVHIYRKDGSVDVIGSFDEKVSGEDVLPGFNLELTKLKAIPQVE
ncbi:MAG: Uma2 family endonuclease [Bacteroidota bacterium]